MRRSEVGTGNQDDASRSRKRALSAECADRELNPGYELGKLVSYHWTIGARGRHYPVATLERSVSVRGVSRATATLRGP